MPHPAGGIVALFMADDHQSPIAKRCKASDDRLIVGKGAVPRQWHEIVEKTGDIILEMRPFGVAGDLRLLPRRQLGIGVAQHLGRALLQRRDFAVNVNVASARRGAQFDDARLQFGDGLFKFQKANHGAGVRAATRRRQRSVAPSSPADGGC